MNGCTACQALLLDHLYGLLDQAEEQDLRSHLAGCPECQAALETACAQQRLLAAAAMQTFPEVSFAPPAPEPVLLPLRPRQPKRARRWAGWVAAACVLITLSPLAIPAYRAAAGHAEARRAVAEYSAAAAEARKEIEDASRLLASAADARDKGIADVHREIKDRELRLVVSGPHTVQAGAAAEYQVRSFDPEGKPADADLRVSVGARDAGEEAKAGGKGESKPGAKEDDRKPGAFGKGGGFGFGKDGAKGDDKAEKDMAASVSARPRVERVEKGLYKVHLPPTLPVEAGRTLAMHVTATRANVKPGEGGRPLSLTGAVRLTQPVYLTHLTTDRPMYQPGDVVHFRSLTLERATLTPPAEPLLLRYTLTPPSGPERPVAAGLTTLRRYEEATKKLTEASGPDGKPLSGLGAGELGLPADAPGGEYTLTVHEDGGRFQPVTRKFIVSEYKKPRLDRKIELNKPSYGPGDEVQVLAKAKRLDGGPLGDIPVVGSVFIDGHKAGHASAKLNNGEAVLRFQLPRVMQRGLGSVSVEFKDPGTPETSSRPLPIVLGRLDVEFFPEGGDLVAGLPGRVYFSARTPAGKPAQVSGTLLENGKPLDVTASTMHDEREPGVNQGLGSFSFTPKADKTYTLRIDSPSGIAAVALPKVQPDGVALRVDKGVFHPDEAFTVRVESSKPRTLLVGAYCRDTLLDSAYLEPGATKAILESSSPVGGVCRITVFEVVHTGAEQKHLRPVAERLVYRHPGKRVDVSILPGSKYYPPADRAKIKILATDEKEKPVPVIAQVAVVDQALLGMADERTARTMPTHFLLASEVRRAEDLEHADFLIGQHPRAGEVLDHLLGTQGWRRFAEAAPEKFKGRLREEGESLPESERQQRESDGERLLVMIGHSAAHRTDFDQERIDKALADFEAEEDRLLAKHAEAAEGWKKASADPAYLAAVATLEQNARLLRLARLVALALLAAAAIFAAWRVLSRVEKEQAAWLSGLVGASCAVLLVCLAGIKMGDSAQRPLLDSETGTAIARLPREEFQDALAIDRPEDRERNQGGFAGGPPMAGGVRPGLPGGPPLAPWGGPMIGGAFGGPPMIGGPPVPGGAPPAMPAPPSGMGGGKGGSPLATAGKSRAAVRGQAFQALMDQARELEARRSGINAPAADGKPTKKDAAFFAPGMAGGGRGARFMDRIDPKAREAKEAAAHYQPLVYREYAHVRPEALSPSVRADFAETVYWHPVLVLPEGAGEVEFQLPDSVTRFQAAVFAHTLDGRLGAATKFIDSRLPVNLAVKLPPELTDTDRPLVPVSVASTVDRPLDGRLTVTGSEGLEVAREPFGFSVPANGSRRFLLPVKPNGRDGKASITLEARGAVFAGDAVKETARVVPDGFPVEGSSSDLLEKSATHKVGLPADMIPGSLKMRVDLYPSPLADLSRGLEGLLREPNGCFEQTSSSNYPNILVLDYLKAAGTARPNVEQKARTLLAKGYTRLTGFECQDPATKAKRGYEWFGGTAPPHDALTAYGLLQFHDMARLHPVDSAMMERTRAHLLSIRDGKGGFARSTKALDRFGGAPAHVTSAYIVWALTETGKEDLSAEQDALTATAGKNADPYFTSLVALGLCNAGKPKEARELLSRVAKAQKADGSLDAETSITRSGGIDLQIEATSLAVIGWLRSDRVGFARNVQAAVKWIGTQRQGSGSFGSTQATILALKALLAHSANETAGRKDADLVLYHGEREVARVTVPAKASEAVSLEVPAPEALFKAGVAGKLRAELTNGAAYPHTLSWSCRALKPANEPTQLVKLSASLSKPILTEGETARVLVRVENKTGAVQGMATAVIGLPAGVSLPENLEQLRSHCKLPPDGKAPLLSAFEVRGREVVLYWRGLEAGQTVEVPFDVVAKVPGTYRGPASRAYLYYNARNKHWVDPLAVEIKPAG